MDRLAAVELTPSGREHELALLLREHSDARERKAARFAFVHGAAGVGKSYLFAALRRALAAQGTKVFCGQAPRSSPRAWGLFAEMVPQVLAHLGEIGIPARTTAELAKRLAPLSGHAVDSRGELEESRLDLCDGVAELFSLAGIGSPAFLFSNAEVADRASLELLRYLGAAALTPGARSGGLFVVSYRDGVALPRPLAELVARTPALGLPLTGLDLEGIRAFLSRREVAERLLETTGGMPTALTDVIASPVPRPADLLARRLAGLSQDEREVMLAIAVLDQPCDAPMVGAFLEARSEGVPKGIAACLERLTRERYLEISAPTLGGFRYVIAREQTRQAILTTVTEQQLAQLHRAAARILRARGADEEIVARHLLTADPRGEGARAALEAAETLAARSAFDEAADLFRGALDGIDEAQKPAVHARLAQILRACGDYAGAMRHLGLAKKGPPENRRALAAEAAKILLMMGRLTTAERMCRDVLDSAAFPVAGDEPAASAYADWAEILFKRGKFVETREHCERGLKAFPSNPRLALALRNSLGKALLYLGSYDAAAAAHEANRQFARENGLANEEARALIAEGKIAQFRGDCDAAARLYRSGLELRHNDRALSAVALSNLGILRALSADFEPAIESLGRALTSFIRARRAQEAALTALNLSRIHLFLGETERARELLEHARAVSGEVGDSHLAASVRLVRGEILEETGALAEAAQELTLACREYESINGVRYAAESALALARVHLARGERSLARAALESESLAAAVATSGGLLAEKEVINGELALLAGEMPEATRALSHAKQILLENKAKEGWFFETPFRVYHLLSKVRTNLGDTAGAAADAARAARLLDELANHIPVACRSAFLRHPRRAAVLAAAAEREITPAQVYRGRTLCPEPRPARELIGKSAALKKIFKVLEAVGRCDATVLIRGESGTGKELLAEAIHRRSPRKDMSLVKVNCAAMVDELLLSELFGHEKGAFTGAIRERKGRFELAEGGTLFLDEIGDVSPKTQVALLRVLQEHEFERVGGQKTLHADVRVICATNRNLEAAIAEGRFRQDLYYRLRGVMLELPPLRDRLEDLDELCEHLLARVARQNCQEKKVLSPEALRLLASYSWPGNIRELENVLTSACVFSSNRLITPEAFESIAELAPLIEPAESLDGARKDERAAPPSSGSSHVPPHSSEAIDYFELARQRGISLKELREEMEVQCISRALTQAKGNISEAARLLQMKRSRLSQIVNANPALRSGVKGEQS